MKNIDWGILNSNKNIVNMFKEEIFLKDTYQKFFKVKKDDVVLDIGSGIGDFSSLIGESCPSKIICVEPDKRFFETLTNNVNKFSPNSNNIFIYKGIGDIDGISETKGLTNIDSEELWNDNTLSIDIETIQFKTIVKEYNIKVIDFLKIDCEGAEYSVFNDENFDWIKNNVKRITGEFHLQTPELKNKFRKFRDTYLKYFKNFDIYSLDDVDIKWSLWDEWFINYYGTVNIWINNENEYWKTTNIPTLEITTNIPNNGCVNDCLFCPQRTLVNAYNGNIFLTLENFKKVIDKLPEEISITFAGFSEPFMNINTTDMILYAHEKNHEVSVFTTGVGLSIKDLKRLKDIPYSLGSNGGFCLHLPDKNGYAKHPINKNYIKTLKYIKEISKDINNFYVMCMGEIHDNVSSIFEQPPIPQMWSRSGNLFHEMILKPELISHKNKFNAIYHKNDNITCGIEEKLYHNVMLPNGDVSLCCMDYKLENIIGNLFTDNYDDIIPVPNTCFNICKFCENGIISSTSVS